MSEHYGAGIKGIAGQMMTWGMNNSRGYVNDTVVVHARIERIVRGLQEWGEWKQTEVERIRPLDSDALPFGESCIS